MICPKVSVIVPVFNCVDRLEQTLSSIFAQSCGEESLELICVDDCSSDGSGELLDRISAYHPRMRVIHQPDNRGVSAARNAGLCVASGDYLLFVDADDLVDPDLVSTVARTAMESGAQMTVYGFDEYYGDSGSFVPREMFDDPELLGRAFSLSDLKCPATELVTPNVWRILFERDFVEKLGLRFHGDLATSEDLAFIYEALPFAERIRVVSKRLYHYRRDGGATLTRGNRGLAGYAALSHVSDFYAEHQVPAAALPHFVNIVADVAQYAMGSASSAKEFFALYEGFHGSWLDLVARNRVLLADRYLGFLESMEKLSAGEYLFRLYSDQRARAEALDFRAAAAEAQSADVGARLQASEARVADLEGSTSYKLGRALTALPGKIKHRG